MLEVHYFAGYRERLGLDRERLDWQPQLASVSNCARAWWRGAVPGRRWPRRT